MDVPLFGCRFFTYAEGHEVWSCASLCGMDKPKNIKPQCRIVAVKSYQQTYL